MDNKLILNISDGYTVTPKIERLDIKSAVEVLRSKKRKAYISADRKNYNEYAELHKEMWTCPFCCNSVPITFFNMKGLFRYTSESSGVYASNQVIDSWGSEQLSFLSPAFEKIMINPSPMLDGKVKCPKCEMVSLPKTNSRKVIISGDDLYIKISAEILGLEELPSLPWLVKGPATIKFPLYETLMFDLKNGSVSVSLESENDISVSVREITDQPEIWKKGVVYLLLRDNLTVQRSIKRAFINAYGGPLPFEKEELTIENYILMTRFIGFPRDFYASIPFAAGKYKLEETFLEAAQNLHDIESADLVFQNSSLPKCKSIKRIIYGNLGLLFYINECEKLWDILKDVNYFRELITSESIYSILSVLRERPILFEFVSDYFNVRGFKSLYCVTTKQWRVSYSDALDYCTYNPAGRLIRQKKWKESEFKEIYQYNQRWLDVDDDLVYEPINPIEHQVYQCEHMFSIPMCRPVDSIENCIINGFSFIWLRSSNDYIFAGKELHNCLGGWSMCKNPVIVVKKHDKLVAAIEVNQDKKVMQKHGYENSVLLRVPDLYETFQKWMNRYGVVEYEKRYEPRLAV